MKSYFLLFFILLFGIVLLQPSEAHRSGCHSWHSCPSDTGSYTCGDREYCSGCPDNEYCKNGFPIAKQSSTKQPALNNTPSNTIKNNTQEKQDKKQPKYTDIIGFCKGKALCINGTIESIVDGDTLIAGGFSIRLALVNTPEYFQKGYKEAKSFASNLCKKGAAAIIDQDDLQPKDKYGRMVAVVYCQGKNLNEGLLVNKHATILKQYCKVSEFRNESWASSYGCS